MYSRAAVKRAGGFVRHDDFGVFDKRPCDCDALFLPAGQLVGFPFSISRKPDFVQNFVDFFVGRFCPLKFQRKRDIRTHVEVFQNVVFLKNKAEIRVAVTVEIARGELLGRLAFDDDFAAVRRVEPAHNVQ